jgi:hypothetical protein
MRAPRKKYLCITIATLFANTKGSNEVLLASQALASTDSPKEINQGDKRTGRNAAEVVEFNLFLSPRDVWHSSNVKDSAPSNVKEEDSRIVFVRGREGYFEVIEMS